MEGLSLSAKGHLWEGKRFTSVAVRYSPWAHYGRGTVNANGHHQAGRRVLLVPHLPGRGLLFLFSRGEEAARGSARGGSGRGGG